MNRVTSLCLVVPSLLAACAIDDPDDELALAEDVAEVAGDCPVSGTIVDRSLVVTDPTALSRFSFTRVINRIRATAGVGAGQTNLALFQDWMRTFTDGPGGCTSPGIDPEGYGLACPRTPEAKLAEVNPFAPQAQVKFVPVGLFNRFDLAPANGAHCGEYRIVYAMQSTSPNINGRAFIIFEGILPNPYPDAGVDACLPVAAYWQDLSNDDDAASRADKLERLYFTNHTIPGFRSVVHAQAYGFANGTTAAHGAGQIRTNFFVDFFEWHLREFKLRKTCDPATDPGCRLDVEHVTTKTNPAEELFANTHPRAAAFGDKFLTSVSRLARGNLNLISMRVDDVFNEFESVSQRFDVDYQAFATPGLRGKINAKLSEIGSSLNATHILRRATTQTCAGCHQVSNSVPLGAGRIWPNSLGFVHIDESGSLSDALTSTFLPRRKTVLEAFINARCGAPPPPPTDDSVTVGGSPVGAPN